MVGTMLLMAIALSGPLEAQPRGDNARGDEGRAAKLRKRFRKKRGEILRRRVGLSGSKVAQVEAILDKHTASHRKLAYELRRSRRTLGRLLRSDSDDQQAFASALAALQRTAQAKQQLRQTEFGELQQVLTPKEQAKLLRTLNIIRRKLHQRRMKRRKRPRRRPRGERRRNRRNRR